jgi:hypothetical protein
MTFDTAIRDALAEKNQRQSISRVHELVANSVKEFDPRAEVATTGYFNHSWAPDLVISWPHDRPASSPERPLFLRFDVRHPAFARELELFAESRPIFLDLQTATGDGVTEGAKGDKRGDQTLTETAEGRALVAESSAVSRVDQELERNRDVRTATRELVRGGRGFFDEAGAEVFVTNYDAAITEISGQRRAAELRDVLGMIETFLDKSASLRLEQSLRTKWISTGAPPSDFPGLEPWDIAGRTPAELADLVDALLDQPEPVAPSLWTQIATHVTADALGIALRSRTPRRGGRLNEFVRQALTSWNSQWAYAPALPSDTLTGEFDWIIGQYGLGLQLINRELFFSDDGRRFAQVPEEDPLPDAAARVWLLRDENVIGLALITPDENVAITLRESASHSIGELIEDLFLQESVPWRAARIAGMTLRVEGHDAELHVDFRRGVSTASRPLPLRTFVHLLARYVAALPAEDLDRLHEALDVQEPEPA